MERIAFKGTTWEEMERWDRERAVSRVLRERVYGTECPDLREVERDRDR